MLSFKKSSNVLWIKKQIYHIIPGGRRAATSSVLISSNKLEIPSLNPFDFSVVGVEDVVTSGFSIAEGLNPGGKKALISSNFNEFNNEGFDEEEGSLSESLPRSITLENSNLSLKMFDQSAVHLLSPH